MQPYNSDAKVVKGLGIANLVISIVSIVLLIICLAFACVGIDYIAKAATSDGDIVGQDVIEFSDTLSDELAAMGNGALNTLSTGEVGNIKDILTNANLKEIHALGSALMYADLTQAEKQLKVIDKKYDLGLDIDAIIVDLGSMSDYSLGALGDYLLDLDHDDLMETANQLKGLSTDELRQNIDEVNGLLDSDENITLVAEGVSALIVAFFVFYIAINVLVLVTAALAIRNCRKPNKLTATFVLSIVSAVITFFTACWISTILLVIMAVYIGKVRKYRDSANDGNADGGNAAAADAAQNAAPSGVTPVAPQ